MRCKQHDEDGRLHDLLRDYKADGRKPMAKREPELIDAAVRTLQSHEEDRAANWYREALREKPRAWSTWNDIDYLTDRDAIAAVTGYGACGTSGTPAHKKKCKAAAKTLATLDPAIHGDLNALDKLLQAVGKLVPWNGELKTAIEAMKERLLDIAVEG